MTDLYNKEDKADKAQAINAKLAHLSDRAVVLKSELYDTELEIQRLKLERDFGDQAGD